jgi:hypothetical protein
MKKGILAVVSFAFGVAGGVFGGKIFKFYFNNEKSKEDDKVYKFKLYYNILNQWLMKKNEGKSITEYFISNGYKTIAIYGMGELGCRLYEELKDSEIKVSYAIDKESGSIYSELEVCSIEEELQPVDALIVTAVFAFDKIEEELEKIVDFPIISLEDVVC